MTSKKDLAIETQSLHCYNKNGKYEHTYIVATLALSWISAIAKELKFCVQQHLNITKSYKLKQAKQFCIGCLKFIFNEFKKNLKKLVIRQILLKFQTRS